MAGEDRAGTRRTGVTFGNAYKRRDELPTGGSDELCALGCDAASLNWILTVSGMRKGQLCHHFDGKAGLDLALVGWMIDARAAGSSAIRSDPRGLGGEAAVDAGGLAG